LRQDPPVLTHVDVSLSCYTYHLASDDDYIPSPDDYSTYKFASLGYWNRALAEKWVSSTGDYLYTNVFSRDVVGMGHGRNVSDPDSQAVDFIVSDWSDEAPDGADFLLPNTINCPEYETGTSNRFEKRGNKPSHGKVCSNCKDSMKKKINDMCHTGKTPKQVCRQQKNPMPDCEDGIVNACSPGALTPEAMCVFMKLC
jgi:hypothetical protein